jgi:hypothetical protein
VRVEVARVGSRREILFRSDGLAVEENETKPDASAPDEAFDILRRPSQHLNLAFRNVVQSLVDIGEKPRTGPPP